MTHSDKAPTAEQLAMARRIARERWPSAHDFPEREAAEAAALAAIIETTPREAALIEAVRGALECLGKPDGYLPDIGAPKTRALQRAFEAYEPHPTFKGY